MFSNTWNTSWDWQQCKQQEKLTSELVEQLSLIAKPPWELDFCGVEEWGQSRKR